MRRVTILFAICAATFVSLTLAMSIENNPVKVTHRNSGPRYDFDDVERTKLGSESNSAGAQSAPEPSSSNDNNNDNNNNSNNNNDNSDNESDRKPQEDGSPSEPSDVPLGHLSIRRIFLIPMMQQRARPDDWQTPPDSLPSTDIASERPTGILSRPPWPFMAPRGPPSHRSPYPHLFGADQASRSPALQDEQPASGERERDPMPERNRPLTPQMIDPIQMMLDLMSHALTSQMLEPPSTDLSKEASSNSNESDNRQGGSSLDEPLKPSGQNETKEEIVEIDGKKYLCKTIINRHMGKNIAFMTKRLIFVPLGENDTETSTAAAATTTSGPNDEPTTTTTTTLKPDEISNAASGNESPEVPMKPSTSATPVETELATTTVVASDAPTTTSETTRTDKPSPETVTASPTSAVTSSVAPEETTAREVGWVDRISSTIDKAAERLVDSVRASGSSSSTTTEKPAAN